MSPSSPVSVGMTPSNRTLELGLLQVTAMRSIVLKCTEVIEQFPTGKDPFTVEGPVVMVVYSDGIKKARATKR